MKGKLYVKNGMYYVVINYKDSYGKYKQKWIATKLKERGNKKNAEKILEEVLEKFKENKQSIENDIVPQNQDFGFIEYIKRYIEEKKSLISESTMSGYMHIWKTLNKYFGSDLKLKDITYKHILGFYDYMKAKHNTKNVTLKKYQEILAPALRLAYRDDLIPKNPYEFMPKLKREKDKREYYNEQELEKLFEVSDKTQIGLIIKVTSYYGFRRSEVLGIRWKSIDFEHKTITIENKVLNIKKKVITSEVLKTLSSNRTLPLLPEIETLLINRKKEIEHNKILYGNEYNHKYDDYVFVDDLGNIFLPDNVTHQFRKILKKNNLKLIRFHDLRHSCASLLVNKKVPMKNIQEWLGHSTYNLTADTYSHLNYDSKIESANVISQSLSQTYSQSDLEKEIEEIKRILDEKIRMQENLKNSDKNLVKQDEYKICL